MTDLDKPIQIAEILYRDRVIHDIDPIRYIIIHTLNKERMI